jgi:predicted ATPase
MAWAVAQGADALEGRAFESGSRMSYQPLVEAFRPLLERADTPLGLLGEARLAPLSYMLPELRERYPELPATNMEVDGGRTQLFESLVHLTLVLAGRLPLVLFVDDLQWADSATLDWLVYAIRRWRDSSVRIVLLVSLRSEALQPPAQAQLPSLIDWLAHVEREVEPFHLELGPLKEQDTVEMMLSILAPPAADFAQWVFYETRGQPFYLMETLKDLLERRALHPKRRAEGQWVFEIDAEHDLGKAIRVPSTVRVVILSRLNRLSPSAFALLVAGAILEQRITFERLCAISSVAENIGLPALDELVSGRLLLEVEQAGVASAYAFSHNIIRDVVYTEAGDARRRLFHRRALDSLEADGDSPAVLAHHALASGQAEEAFRYSLTAGQEALRLSAVSETIGHLEQARQLALEGLLDSVEIKSDIRNLYAQLARTYALNGQPEQAQAVQDELQRLPPQQP